ncbi:cupredoxin domain-containing protein [Candidatus Uhrbacteria bacterium]|nr:cupredoxin domain-containing protein [Candidatus Uhrbacteria bacterium]
MKNIFPLLAVLVLVGAGCAAQTDSQTSAEATADVEFTAGQNADEPTNGASEDSDAANVQAGLIVEIDEFGNVTTQNDVPVIEVVLGEEEDVSLDMETGNFFFSTKEIKASPGDLVRVTFTKNSGFHTFVIDELNLNFAIVEGEALTFTAPSEPGTYPIYCDIGSHRAFGMEGALIVE